MPMLAVTRRRAPPAGGSIRCSAYSRAATHAFARSASPTRVKVLYDSGETACTTQIVDIVEQTGVLLQRGREVEEGRNARWHGFEMVDYEEKPYMDAEMPSRRVELSYGNDPSLGHVYGNAALFARVPACGDGVRAARAEVEA
ncbi:hypothetical protein C8J57DRAFT_1491913 [Mycena rebaudengoi]|nr:hypothetical protein C8J57DRAFT_1491913 [Mycena rebaudengoi]